jgi:Transposase DNA-binding
MSNWMETEMGACQLHDARSTKRLARLLARLSEKPVPSMPSACQGWAETKVAYRFLDNPGHWRAGDSLGPYTYHAGAESGAGSGLIDTRHAVSG